MARIYYKEKKIYGKSFENNIINSRTFDYLKDNTDATNFEILPQRSSFLGIFTKEKPVFRLAQISRDDINYPSNEGNFYLPDAIIFYDEKDYVFPTEFYFIAKIDNRVELRKCNAGKDIQWFEIPELHIEITDSKIITKIENTILRIKELVETTHKKKKNAGQQDTESVRPLINQEQRNAFKQLADLCLGKNEKKTITHNFFDSLKNYDGDEEYFTTLNFVINFLKDNKMHFIMDFDMKSEIENLEWNIQSALKENFGVAITLPKAADFKYKSISGNGVLGQFDKRLRENGFQISCINTESDEYVILIHTSNNQKNIEDCVKRIGYSCEQF